MRIDVLTLFPEVFENLNSFSIIKKAIDSNKVQVRTHNLRDYADNSRKVDDYPYGGFPGMLIKIEPIDKCIEYLKKDTVYDEIIYMTPDAKTLNQSTANTLSLQKNIIILTGHYKGVDQRVRDKYISKEISIGDYVLTGGELAAAVLIDSIVRLVPGVIGDETSALTDSFQDNLLGHSNFTRHSEFNGWKVPEVLLSGDQSKSAELLHPEFEKIGQPEHFPNWR